MIKGSPEKQANHIYEQFSGRFVPKQANVPKGIRWLWLCSNSHSQQQMIFHYSAWRYDACPMKLIQKKMRG
jgi:hypothetical protein